MTEHEFMSKTHIFLAFAHTFTFVALRIAFLGILLFYLVETIANDFVAAWIYSQVMFLIIALLMFGNTMLRIYYSSLRPGDEPHTAGAAVGIWLTLTGIYLVAFGLSWRHAFLVVDPSLFGIHVPEGASFWTWIAFAFDNFLEAALLDAPAIYDFHLSNIEPASPLSRTSVFIHRIAIHTVLLGTVLFYLRLRGSPGWHLYVLPDWGKGLRRLFLNLINFRFIRHAITGMLTVVACVIPIILVAELSGLVLDPLPIALYGISLIIVLLLLSSIAFEDSKEVSRSGEQPQGTEVGVTAALAICYVAAYTLLTRQIYLFTDIGFHVSGDASLWTWIGFGLDNFLAATLFDAPEIYDFHVSNIDHASFAARNVVFFFRLSIDVMILAAIAKYLFPWRPTVH